MSDTPIVIVTCSDDAAFVPPFLEMIRGLWPSTPLYLGMEAGDDDLNIPDLPPRLETSTDWSKGGAARVSGVLGALSEAAEAEGASHAIKMDCDMVHRTTDWFDEGSTSALQGFQHQRHLGYAIGFAYSVRADALGKMIEATSRLPQMHLAYEDLGVSATARYLFPNGIHLLPIKDRTWAGLHPGYPDERYDKCDFIHCGQGGPREEGVAAMRRLAQRKVLEK